MRSNCYIARVPAEVVFIIFLLVAPDGIILTTILRHHPPSVPWLVSKFSTPWSPFSSRTESKALDSSCGAKGTWPKTDPPRHNSFALNLLRQSSHHLVYNGYSAIEGQFPSHVDLLIKLTYKKVVCGGTLLTLGVVLTAAHCVDKNNIEEILVSASAYKPPRDLIKANRWCKSPDYNPFVHYSHDYAIIILEQPFDISGSVKTACLPSRALKSSDKCYCIGSGKTDPNSNAPSKRLMYFPCSRMRKCERDGYTAPSVINCFDQTNEDLLINGIRSSNCQGDSGEGVMCFIDDEWQVHGIVSTGSATDCTPGNADGFYTDVEKVSSGVLSLKQHCEETELSN